MRFIFLTKTEWSEAPRIRHQLARMLSDAGHQILFFEKPGSIMKKVKLPSLSEGNIKFFRFRELLHHKLRLNKVLYKLNSWFVIREIKLSLLEIDSFNSCVVVNFCYEYGFLRDIFKTNTIITVINDDFWSRAIFKYDAPLKNALQKTCAISNKVLCVSLLLKKELDKYSNSVVIFYPWAKHHYSPPHGEVKKRNILLFFGYINDKLDYNFISNCALQLEIKLPNIRLVFVGPIQVSINSVNKYSNIEFKEACTLDELPINQCLSCFIPYRINVPNIDAISLPNKASQLLPMGMPLMITGMPYFINEDFVFRVDEKNIVDIIKSIKSNFNNIQESIQKYVGNNLEEKRLAQFIEIIKNDENFESST